MRPLTAQQITGTWATLLSPINSDDSIDFAALEAEIDAIIAAKVSGVYSNGTAGEFHTQSEDEFDRVNELLARKCEKAGLPFQIGASHMSAQISMARLKRAKALAPSAFQVILPDWFKLTDHEAKHFLETMAAAADPIRLILYNPPHAKRVLKAKELAELLRAVPAVIGAKVAPTDEHWMSELGEIASERSIFTPGHFLATHYPQGSKGAYSNVACLNPGGAERWFKLIQAGDPRAMQIQDRLLKFFAAEITPFITRDGYCNAAVDKLLAVIGGWCPISPRLRWPYRWINPAIAKSLAGKARDAVPELFNS